MKTILTKTQQFSDKIEHNIERKFSTIFHLLLIDFHYFFCLLTHPYRKLITTIKKIVSLWSCTNANDNSRSSFELGAGVRIPPPVPPLTRAIRGTGGGVAGHDRNCFRTKIQNKSLFIGYGNRLICLHTKRFVAVT